MRIVSAVFLGVWLTEIYADFSQQNMHLCFCSLSGFRSPKLISCAKCMPKSATSRERTRSCLTMTAERNRLKMTRLAAVSNSDMMMRQFVTYEQVAEAVAKFEHAVEQGKPVESSLVAERVSVSYWLYGTNIGERFPNVHFHIIAYDDEISAATLGDLYIVKSQNAPHESSVESVQTQLSIYAAQSGDQLRVIGGNMLLPGEVRRPDTALAPRGLPDEQPIMPRFLCEVEVSHRTLAEADEWCREYFGLIPQLRALLLVQFYGRRQDQTFAALAVLYRRETTGIQIDDAVSFGTAPISNTAVVPQGIKDKIRSLPLPVLAPKVPTTVQCPWQPKDNAVITLRAEDLYYWKTSGNARLLIPTVVLPVDDCRISLWTVLRNMNELSF